MSDLISREAVLRLLVANGVTHALRDAIAALPVERGHAPNCRALHVNENECNCGFGALPVEPSVTVHQTDDPLVLGTQATYCVEPDERDEDAERLLVQFGAWCIETYRESFGDLDGGSVQDEAERLGILVNIPVSEPCGESCNCAEYGDFPQNCLRYSEKIRAAIDAARRDHGK